MRGLIARFESADDLPADRTDVMRLDLTVHRAMYRAAGNPHLEDVLIRYHNLATRIFCLLLERLPDVADHVNEHAALLSAIVAGEADAAAEVARAHVAGFEVAVRAVI
jgi:DNA-binding GntR family transcriptional regulator